MFSLFPFKQALMAPLANNWKPCRNIATGDTYYFNFTTGESSWLHPNDAYYRKVYSDEKKRLLSQAPGAVKAKKNERKGAAFDQNNDNNINNISDINNSSSNSSGASGATIDTATVNPQPLRRPLLSPIGERPSARVLLDPLSVPSVFSSLAISKPTSTSDDNNSSASISSAKGNFNKDSSSAASSIDSNANTSTSSPVRPSAAADNREGLQLRSPKGRFIRERAAITTLTASTATQPLSSIQEPEVQKLVPSAPAPRPQDNI